MSARDELDLESILSEFHREEGGAPALRDAPESTERRGQSRPAAETPSAERPVTRAQRREAEERRVREETILYQSRTGELADLAAQPLHLDSGPIDPRETGIAIPQTPRRSSGRIDPRETGIAIPQTPRLDSGRIDPRETGIAIPQTPRRGSGRIDPRETGIAIPQTPRRDSGPIDPRETGIAIPQTPRRSADVPTDQFLLDDLQQGMERAIERESRREGGSRQERTPVQQAAPGTARQETSRRRRSADVPTDQFLLDDLQQGMERAIERESRREGGSRKESAARRPIDPEEQERRRKTAAKRKVRGRIGIGAVLLVLTAILAGLLFWTARSGQTEIPEEPAPIRLELGEELERYLYETSIRSHD